MSWLTVCLLAWGRSLLLAGAAVGLGMACRGWIAARSAGRRKLAWAALLLPFMTPELIVGHGWSTAAAAPVRSAAVLEALYTLLLLLKATPLATVILWFAPPPMVSRAARHCWRLSRAAPGPGATVLPRRDLAASFGLLLRGPLRDAAPALAMAFLFAFQEFEMAALLQTGFGQATAPLTWTVPLFDLQAGGWPLRESLLRGVAPLLLESIVVGPVLWLVLRDGRTPHPPLESASDAVWNHGLLRLAVPFYLAIAGLIGTAIPFASVLRNLPAGVRSLSQDPGFLREFSNSLLLGATAGGVAGVCGGWIVERLARGGAWRSPKAIATLLICFPGLVGSLLLGLTLLGAFQRPVLRPFYDTPIPLVAGLCFHLLPRAFLLTVLVRSAERTSPAHLAEMLRGSPRDEQKHFAAGLLWSLRSSFRFWVAALLAVAAFWELTLASLLAPVGVSLIPVSLYNQMHFGRSTLLAAKAFVCVSGPWIAAAAVAWMSRAWRRRSRAV